MKTSSTPPPASQDLIASALASLLAPIVRAAVADALAEHHAAEAPSPLLDDQKMCALLGVSAPTLRKMLDSGLPHIKCGDHRRYSNAGQDAIAWLQARGAK